jgi:tetratricopeptide (TPR) repeat protein
MSQNKVDAALASYEKAVEVDPGWAAAYVKRGMARRAKSDLDGSIEDYEKSSGLNPRSTANNSAVAESYSNLGLNKLNRLEIDAAVADFTKAISHDGKEPNHFFRRGQARLVNEEFEAAVTNFNLAEALNRGNEFLTTLIYAERGYAMLLQGKQDQAKTEFKKCGRLANGKQFQLRLHLMGLEAQIKERRRHSADALKGIT